MVSTIDEKENKNIQVGIVAANNIRFSPYIFFYTRILEKNTISYELIYPDRNNIMDDYDGEKYRIKWNKKLPSIINYALYGIKVQQIIKKRKYDKIIVLTSINASYLALWLRNHYRGKYIVDIRDYSYEHNRIYAMLESIALRNAGLRVISSEKFKVFLPQMEYLLCHNMSMNTVQRSETWQKKEGVITIGYIGSVAYAENVKKMISLVCKDSRFRFYVYGAGPAQTMIQETVKKANVESVKYYGAYRPEEKTHIINEVDVLFNVYGNTSLLLTCALSNKLYDGMYFRKIILNSKGTYMETTAGICGFSIDLDDPRCLDSFYDYYMNLDEKQVTEYQDSCVKRFTEENKMTEENICRFILG